MEDLSSWWFDPFTKYISDETLLEDKRKEHSIISKSSTYFLQKIKLYRKTPLGHKILCVTNKPSLYILKKGHKGECASYSNDTKLTNDHAPRVLLADYFGRQDKELIGM